MTGDVLGLETLVVEEACFTFGRESGGRRRCWRWRGRREISDEY